jgi:tol-pal system protein YbgF
MMLVFSVLGSPSAQAFFSDDEARKQVNNLNEQVKAAQKNLIEIHSENDVLKQENSKLRGQVEGLEKNVEELQENLKNYYQELNERLKKFEPQNLEVEGVKGTAQAGEKQAYDDALKSFKDGDLKKADKEFSAFSKKYPSSPYWPLSEYWLANTKYGNKDYAGSISSVQSLMKRYPDHQRIPDAMITMANSQLESGQKAAGKKTLESVKSRFGGSKAAKTATEMLSTLK